ncbi:aliphatic amidase amiE [Vibrio sp. JCM 19236]|nr:aliphatic amidase amiE [Vibrio sp. JCM 19236]
MIIHPTMTGTIDRELETCIARTHAVTNQCYFVDINGAGDLGNGKSIVVGPEGDVIYQAGETEQIITFEIDLNRVRRAREHGTMGLGQTLKSYRDNKVEYPQYQEESPYLAKLGPLKMKAKGTARL